MKELEKTYNPAEIEGKLYEKWLDKKYFHAEPNKDKKPFTIVMPPPNITGQLHMGHALDNTMQDILIRYKRMQGYEALWQPGTDHAAIATEVKVIERSRELTRRNWAGKASWKNAGTGEKNMASGSSTSFIRWDPLPTGTESVLPWMKVVQRPYRKFLSGSMKKAIFIKVPVS